jgi:hypothetical protein
MSSEQHEIDLLQLAKDKLSIWRLDQDLDDEDTRNLVEHMEMTSTCIVFILRTMLGTDEQEGAEDDVLSDDDDDDDEVCERT